jgi:hypothetical protein
MLELFKKKTPEEKFWSWFQNNRLLIEQFINSDTRDYSIYNELTDEIIKYDSNLYPELTKTDNDEYVLIITADGKKAGVEPTKRLAEHHPKIDNWIVYKFRQPVDEIELNFDGLVYPSSDIEIIPHLNREEEKVDIDVFIRNMDNQPEKYKALAFLYLDHILGEFNTITRVGYIDFHHLNDNKTVEDSIDLLQLRNLIASELY